MPEPDPTPKPLPGRGQLHRRLTIVIWRAVALLFVVLAVVGIVLPVVPTVPFLLVSAWAAGKGWPAFEQWLLDHPRFGPPLRHWRERGAVPRRAKWLASIMMAISALGLQFFLALALWVRLGVPLVMLVVAIWLWHRPEA